MDNAKGIIVDSTGALELRKSRRTWSSSAAASSGWSWAAFWRRLGAKVTVVEFLDQILPGMDGDVRREANKIFRKQGIEFKLSTKVTSASVKDGKAVLTLEPAAGGDAETIEADVVLVSIGRRPNTEGLGLDMIGLPVNKRGQIETDHAFATSIPGIWAIGDVIPGRCWRTRRRDEGIAVAENIAVTDRHREP